MTNMNEEQMDAYLDMKENSALDVFRGAGGVAFQQLPEEYKEMLENAFLVGYSYGGVEHEEDLRTIQKSNPVAFKRWIDEE